MGKQVLNDRLACKVSKNQQNFVTQKFYYIN